MSQWSEPRIVRFNGHPVEVVADLDTLYFEKASDTNLVADIVVLNIEGDVPMDIIVEDFIKPMTNKPLSEFLKATAPI